MDSLLVHLSDSITRAQSLEQLTRPLLVMLEAVTGLESTYLTMIDEGQGVQKILFARNTKELVIPEGLSVPWADTLCKRALEEDRLYVDDVPSCWGDSEAARALAIQTYASAPVKAADGALYGTLCAASSQRKPLVPDADRILRLFSRLIAQHIEREQLVEQLKKANADLAAAAFTDPLTGLANRRQLTAELGRLLARAKRDGSHVLVAFMDLDGFKAINDRHGHDAGDAFLCAIAGRVQSVIRASDLAARLGGDEFVVVRPGPQLPRDALASAEMLARRLTECTQGVVELAGLTLDYVGASVGSVAIAPGSTDPDGAVQQADAAMYQVKLSRKRPVA